MGRIGFPARLLDLAANITEPHGAQPFCFYFTTRGRTKEDLDSRLVRKSGRYFLNCRTRTLEEVQADPESKLLAANMKSAGWKRVAATKTGPSWTQPIHPGDAVLKD